MSASSQSLRFILSLRPYSNFITSRPGASNFDFILMDIIYKFSICCVCDLRVISRSFVFAKTLFEYICCDVVLFKQIQTHFHIIFILLIPNLMQVMKFPSGLYWVIPYNDIISPYILSACLGMDIILWTRA